ncbi:MAG: hypothetical protein H0T79_15505 [Deltaproteobacteria bacterium]|nr:hypothetical protein [Deltaproteobacteria bacterium]
MTNLSLGAAIYYDTDLSTDPAALRTLWEALTQEIQAPLIQWTGTVSQVGKKGPLDLAKLDHAVASGDCATAAIETAASGLLVLSHTTPAARLKEPLVPRPWRYDTAVAISGELLSPLGRQQAVEAIVGFADAVAAKAGVVYWTDSVAFASALATGGLGSGMTSEQEHTARDSHDLSNHWGRIIRGPAWGTLLGAAHVAKLGDVTRLPATRVMPLNSGGAFVQLTEIDDAVSIDEPSPELEQLRAALAPVLP